MTSLVFGWACWTYWSLPTQTNSCKSSRQTAKNSRSLLRFHAIVIFNISTINVSLHSEVINCTSGSTDTHTDTQPSGSNGIILSKKIKSISHATIIINSATPPWNRQMLRKSFGTLKIWMWRQVIAERLYEILLQQWLIACQFKKARLGVTYVLWKMHAILFFPGRTIT